MLYGTISNLELNLRFLFDIIFLKDGHFKNIIHPTTIRGYDVSKLVLDYKAESDIFGVSGCQVWQSPYQSWVYESGITLNPSPFISGKAEPIIASGVYINNTFFNQSSGVSGIPFYIDYLNGRVAFSGTGIPSNSIIQADYAYKTYLISSFDTNIYERLVAYADMETKDEPLVANSLVYPSGDELMASLPAIFIDIDGPTDMQPYELGNRAPLELYTALFYIFTTNRRERNAAKELIMGRYSAHQPMIDYNYAPFPLSGLINTLSPDYIPYQTLLENPTYRGSKVISWQYHIDNVRGQNIEPDGDPFMKAVMTMDIEVENVAPTGRIPINPYIG